MTPFEKFFAEDFPRKLATVRGQPGLFSDGGRIENASWDRKAAYLLWLDEIERRGGYTERMTEQFSAEQFGDDDEDLIGGAPAVAADEDDEADLI